MSDAPQCPSEEVLIEFAEGTLPKAECDVFRAHLAGCQQCTNALEWLTTHYLPRLKNPSFNEDEDAEGSTNDSPSVLHTVSLSSIHTRSDRNLHGDLPKFDIQSLTPSRTLGSLGMIGRYEVVSILDQGGSSVILKAIDPTLGRMVAVKVLDRNFAQDEKARIRFAREARAASMITHPNIIVVHSLEEHAEIPFMVLEFVAGGSIAQVLRRKGRFEPADAIRHTLQIAAGLIAAHLRGVIHRDIKPANLLLDRSTGRLRITDFGLARIVADNSTLTSRGHIVGTPGYMSPEQVEGEPVDFRTDLFGTGCVLYEMLSGIAPFHGESYLQINQKLLDDSVEPIGNIVPSLPSSLCEIVERLLEKDPDDRIQDAGELANLLERELNNA